MSEESEVLPSNFHFIALMRVEASLVKTPSRTTSLSEVVTETGCMHCHMRSIRI